MSLIGQLKSDAKANRNNPKGKFIVKGYRIANYLYKLKKRNLFLKVLTYPFLSFYRFLFWWILCIEIPEAVAIGSGLEIWHGFGLVINPDAILGNNVLLRHHTTIGNKYVGSLSPVIGNNVNIGAHTIIIGDVVIGNNVTIGAGSVVTKSIPSDCIAYGNPLIIKKLNLVG